MILYRVKRLRVITRAQINLFVVNPTQINHIFCFIQQIIYQHKLMVILNITPKIDNNCLLDEDIVNMDGLTVKQQHSMNYNSILMQKSSRFRKIIIIYYLHRSGKYQVLIHWVIFSLVIKTIFHCNIQKRDGIF